MKSRFEQVIFLGIVLTFCASAHVFAQDAGMSDVEITSVPADERAGFTPGEQVRFVPRPPGNYAPTDSLSLQIQDFPMQRAAQRPPEKPAGNGKKDESILTFNFLYYIIQKYKLQDIID